MSGMQNFEAAPSFQGLSPVKQVQLQVPKQRSPYENVKRSRADKLQEEDILYKKFLYCTTTKEKVNPERENVSGYKS
jgi:hypothetical protein